jgi:hypothetical protein
VAGRTVALALIARDRISKTFAKVSANSDKLAVRVEKLNGITKKATGLATLAGGITALGAAAAPAAAAVAAMPAAMLAAKVASATLKVGLIGVGEAMSAVAEGDAKALDEALKKLSPNARAFVKEAGGLKKAFEPVQQAVQNRLFEGLSGQMGKIGKNLLPTVRKGMVGVAGGLNAMAKEGLKVANSKAFKGELGKIFQGTTGIVKTLSGAVRPLVMSVVRLGAASLPLAKRMAEWAVNGAKAAATFLKSKKGADFLKGAVKGAGDTLATLGRIAKNIASIVVGVFKNAGGAGDGLLVTLEQLTAKANAWVQSAQGQEKIASVFATLREVMTQLGVILPLVVGPLGAIAKVLGMLPAPAGETVAKVIAIGLVVSLLGGKLLMVGKLLFGFGKGMFTVARGAAGFVGGLVKGSAALGANAGAAAKAGAALRTFGGAMSRGIMASANAVTSLSALAGAKLKVAAAATAAGARTVAMTVAQKAAAVASKAMAAATWLVNAAMRANPIGIIITIIMALVGAIVLAYNKSETFRNIVNAVWNGIKMAISNAWNNFIKPALTALWSFITNTLAPKFLWFHNTIVKPVFSAIGAIIKWAWNNLIKPAFAAIVFYYKNILGPVIKWLYNNIVKPIWNAIGAAIRWAWTKIISPAFTAIKMGVDKVGKAFKAAADFIKSVWKKIENAAKAPIKFVVNTVLNNGILKAWNFVADKFNLSPKGLKISLPQGFAKGGILPGFSRKDDQVIAARSGEGILVPEAVKSLGERFVHRANSLKGNAAKLLGVAGDPGGMGIPGFEDGGIVGGLKSFFGKAKDWFMDGVKNATKLVTEPILSSLESAMGGSTFGKMLAGIPRRMVNSFLDWIGGKEDAISAGGGGAGGKAVMAARKQIGVPYSWGGGGPGGPSYGIEQGRNIRGFDCSGLTEYAWWQATHKSIGGTTYAQKGVLKRVGTPRPGDVGQPHPGHTYLMSGPGKIIEAPYTGSHVREVGMRSTPYWGRPPWVMDTGGVLPPGMSPPIYNGTGGPEYVLRPDQIADLKQDSHIVLELKGDLFQLIRKGIRVRGGNVDVAFGTRG